MKLPTTFSLLVLNFPTGSSVLGIGSMKLIKAHSSRKLRIVAKPAGDDVGTPFWMDSNAFN